MKFAVSLSLLVLGNALLLADDCGPPPVVRTLADQPEAQRKTAHLNWEMSVKSDVLSVFQFRYWIIWYRLEYF